MPQVNIAIASAQQDLETLAQTIRAADQGAREKRGQSGEA
jgi:hypothetical protein